MCRIFRWLVTRTLLLLLLSEYAFADNNHTVAVLNFETTKNETSDLGEKVTDLVTAYLSMMPNISLVERSKIEEILKELGLGLSGIVDQTTAAKIGKMVGADMLITGRAFAVGNELFLTARAISVETSRVSVELEKGKLNDNLSAMAENLAKKLAAGLGPRTSTIAAEHSVLEDKIAALIEKVKEKKLPEISVVISETYGGEKTADPACKTELVYILKAAGFKVYDDELPALSNWVRDLFYENKNNLPSTVRGEVIIVGEAIAEFTARRGELVSSKGRVEYRAVNQKDHKILATARTTKAAVDLSVGIAGRKALQEATADIVPEFVARLVDEWNREE